MILRAIVRTLCTTELGYYTGQNKGRQNRRRIVYSGAASAQEGTGFLEREVSA